MRNQEESFIDIMCIICNHVINKKVTSLIMIKCNLNKLQVLIFWNLII